jgi:hypothetical protein
VALDFDSARYGMARDVAEIWREGPGPALVVLFFALPVASLVLLLMRRWLALLPLTLSLALLALWFLYYATDWFGHVSGGVGGLVFAVVLFGWLGLWVAWFAPRMRPGTRDRGHRPAA